MSNTYKLTLKTPPDGYYSEAEYRKPKDGEKVLDGEGMVHTWDESDDDDDDNFYIVLVPEELWVAANIQHVIATYTAVSEGKTPMKCRFRDDGSGKNEWITSKGVYAFVEGSYLDCNGTYWDFCEVSVPKTI